MSSSKFYRLLKNVFHCLIVVNMKFSLGLCFVSGRTVITP